MPRYRITIMSHDRGAMLDLLRTYHLDVFDHGSRYSESEGYVVDAVADAAEIKALRQAGYGIQKHQDIDATGRARQKEVGRGDRYARPPSR